MKKIKIFSLIILSAVIIPFITLIVKADDGASTPPPDGRDAFRNGAIKNKQEARDAMHKDKEDFWQQAKDLRGTATPGGPEMAQKIKNMWVKMRGRNEEEIKTLRETMKGGIKKKLENCKQGKEITLDDTKKQNLKKYTLEAYKKLNEKLSIITDTNSNVKITIYDLKTKGVDTTEIDTLLGTAKTDLDTASDEVAASKSALDAFFSDASCTSKEAFMNVVKEANDSIKNAIKAYHVVINKLPDNGGRIN